MLKNDIDKFSNEEIFNFIFSASKFIKLFFHPPADKFRPRSDLTWYLFNRNESDKNIIHFILKQN